MFSIVYEYEITSHLTTDVFMNARFYHSEFYLSFCCLLVCYLLAYSVCAIASDQTDRTESFTVSQVFGGNSSSESNSSGSNLNQWSQVIQDRPVEQIVVTFRSHNGSSDAFINLKYEGGEVFEGGKRVFVTPEKSITASWNVTGERPNNRPLVLSVYKGEVYVEMVTVNYRSIFVPLPGRKNSEYPSGSNNSQNRYGERNRYNDPKNEQAVQLCRRASIRYPRIDVGRAKPSGGLFSTKYRIEGAVVGNCIVEAGYYEYGRLKESFDVPLSDQSQRIEFNVHAKLGKRGELRVLTTDGKEDVVEVEEVATEVLW